MRIKKVIGVGAMVGGIGIAAAACGPVNVHWETYPTGTSASTRTAEQHWWVNGGGDALLAVNKDGAALYGDLTNQSSETKALTDARALARDAATAARNPWPGNPSAYATMMSDYSAAAQDALTSNPNAPIELQAAFTIQTNAGWATDFPAVPANLTK